MSQTTLGDITTRLDALTDLFQRRLLNDRDKRDVIASLSERLTAADRARDGEILRPLLTGLGLVIDRIDSHAGDCQVGDGDFLGSVTEEILNLLSLHGVREVPTDGPVESGRHEIVAVEGGHDGPLTITRLVGRGFERDGQVLRPARVVAVRGLATAIPGGHV